MGAPAHTATEKCYGCEKQVVSPSVLGKILATAVPDAMIALAPALAAEGSENEARALRAVLTKLDQQLPELAAQVSGYCSLACRRRKVPVR